MIKNGTDTERNYGIDALRILSMLGVVLMHVLYKGSLLDKTSGSMNAVLWFVETVCYCAVNCYAIISGYAIYSEEEKPYRYTKYISLWTGVFFWSFGITAVLFFADGTIAVKEVIKSMLPVIFKRYWYFSAYTVLFFLIPWINRLLRGLSKCEITQLTVTLFLLFSVVGLLHNPFEINYGYSFVWLVFMYIVGAWIKKCGLVQKITAKAAAAVCAVCVFLSWAVMIFSPAANDIFMKYISPTMVLYGGCAVLAFAKINPGHRIKELIAYITPAVFGIYIIHEHPLINCRFEEWFVKISVLDTIPALVCVMLCAGGVFGICLIFEKIRLWIFDALKINEFIAKLLGKLYEKLSTDLTM